MNTNTVEISFPTPARVCGWVSRPAASMTRGRRSHCQAFALTAALALSLLGVNLPSAKASTVLGPWVPIFKGVDHAVGTNTPGGGGFTTLQVAHAIRVDLTDPDVHLFATPRIDDYQVGSHETAGLTVENFLITYKPQVAFNANSFDPSSYYLPQGTAMEAYGLLVSDGTVVSPQESASRASSIVFDANKVARIIHTNWPAVSTSGIYTAVSGEYPILIAGVNVGYRYSGSSAFIHERNPRSAYALSQDRKTLYLLAIDGRQPGYSEGALDWETAAWLIKMGAYDGINMDGGGSTSLVMVDSVGDPIKLNHSNAMADSGNERTVGAHFGIYAPPVRGFINDVVANPEDTTALITWSTTSPATSLVDYGLTPDLGSATALDLTSVTNHQVLVDGLTPGTTYYFAVESIAETTNLISPTFAFTTTNYVTTNAMFDVTYPWKYTTANLDGVSWMDPAYDDSGWSGPGPGLLWIDVRQVPDASVQPRTPSFLRIPQIITIPTLPTISARTSTLPTARAELLSCSPVTLMMEPFSISTATRFTASTWRTPPRRSLTAPWRRATIAAVTPSAPSTSLFPGCRPPTLCAGPMCWRWKCTTTTPLAPTSPLAPRWSVLSLLRSARNCTS